MIRITIELLPGGDETQAQVIGSGEITNIATDKTGELGNYRYEFTTPGWYRAGEIDAPGDVWAGVKCKFPRTRAHVWHLVRECVNDSYKARVKRKERELKRVCGPASPAQ